MVSSIFKPFNNETFIRNHPRQLVPCWRNMFNNDYWHKKSAEPYHSFHASRPSHCPHK